MNESVLIVDKVPGPTSFDVVRAMQPIFGGRKVGHAGSLDPFASGVLVILVGRATKLSNALLNADKSYRATVKLGDATDTLDRTGKVIESKPIPELTRAQVEAAVNSFQGTWNQTPPMYSAKKIQGVRLYTLARKSIEVRRLPIPVELYRMELLTFEPPYLTFEVECSKGTYIRSLAEDLGKRLGTVAHLAELRRLSCGPFKLEEAVTLEKIVQAPENELRAGYQNFVRLLRAEGLIRKPVKSPESQRTSFANAPG